MDSPDEQAQVSSDISEFELLDEYPPLTENEDPSDTPRMSKSASRKTREQLNQIEKQRTRRINQQIQSLRTLLEASGLTTKKDKFSILRNTSEYIKQLQDALSASEQKNQHIQRELQAKCQESLSTVSTSPPPQVFPPGGLPAPAVIIPSDIDTRAYRSAAFAQSIDYQVLFLNASIAMAVTGIDGQFMDCNYSFAQISGFARESIKGYSMFNLTPPEEMNQLFSIVGSMLSEHCESGKHFWKRCRFRERESHCFVSMWLVRRPTGEPAYFQCAVVPLEEIPSTRVPSASSQPTHRVATEADLRLTMPADRRRSAEAHIRAGGSTSTPPTWASSMPTMAHHPMYMEQRTPPVDGS